MGAEKNELKKSSAAEPFVYLNNLGQVAKYLNLPKSAIQTLDFSSELQKLKTFFKDEKKILDFIASFPPMVVSVSENDFKKITKFYASALFMKGTNLIVVSRNSDDVGYILRHEMTHYLSHVGQKQSSQKPPTMFSWFNEGLTVFFAESSAPDSKTKIYDYADGLFTAVLLDTIVGSKNLRHAYLTGDFSAVEKEVDRTFGSGFFRSLISFPAGYVSTTFLIEKCSTSLPLELLAGVIATNPLLMRSLSPKPWESMEKEFAWRHDVLIKDPVLFEMLSGVKSAKPTHDHHLFNKYSLDQIKGILSKGGFHLKKSDVKLTFASAYYILDSTDKNMGVVYTSSWFFYDNFKEVVELFIKKDAPASLKELISPKPKINAFGKTGSSP